LRPSFSNNSYSSDQHQANQITIYLRKETSFMCYTSSVLRKAVKMLPVKVDSETK